MGFKNPKNLIVVISAAAALLAATVLLSGYANSKASEEPVITCQATGCCPASARIASYQATTAAQMASTDISGTPCITVCPKPCCAENPYDGCCDNPCPIPCPKPCCEKAGSTVCPIAVPESNVQ
jgi:hypothetical protein